MQQKIEQWSYWAVGSLLLIYMVLRARLIPMTVDEVTTVINHVPRSIPDILFYSTDAVPNNHIINTLFIKLLVWFFGVFHFTVRIPALSGGVLFILTATAFACKGANAWLRALAFIMLVGNPFVLEFFSLARGYGLAVGIMLAAIYQAVQYFENQKYTHLVAAAWLGALAVETNFTVLNWYVPFLFLLLWGAAQDRSHARIRSLAPILAAGIVIALLAYLPIVRMRASDQFQFWGMSSFYKDTLSALLRSSVHGKAYFGRHTTDWLCVIYIGFTLVSLLLGIWKWRENKWRLNTPILLAGMCGAAVLFNLTQGFLFKTPYLDARTSIFFYPLFALQIITLARWTYEMRPYAALLLVLPWSIYTVANFNNCRNLVSSYEWWFDVGTFKTLDYFKDLYKAENRSTPFQLDTNWLPYNSFDFHINLSTPHYDKYVQLAPWHGQHAYPEHTEFYYTDNPDEIAKLQEHYDIVFRVPDSALLLFRKKQTSQ